MRIPFRAISIALFLAGLAALTVWEGCGPPPRPLAPVFNLYGYQGLAVVPFLDQSIDPALAPDLCEDMTQQIAALNAIPIVQASQVAAFLRQRKAAPSDLLTDEALRNALRARFHCDLLLMGTAREYLEYLKDDPPSRVVGDSGEAQWGFTTHRKATVDATFQILDASTGNLLWSQKNRGYSWKNTRNPLPIPGAITLPGAIDHFIHLADLFRHRVLGEGDEEPDSSTDTPQALIYPHSHLFQDLRRNALHETVRGIMDDFMGHNGWIPNGAVTP